MKELVIELEDECLDCPYLSLVTEILYVDDFFEEKTIKTHGCEHIDFCKAVRKQWEKRKAESKAYDEA